MKTRHKIVIKSLKHDGSLHRQWQENYILKETRDVIIGFNHASKVIESNGDEWQTREPAVFYFHRKHYFNVIALLREDGIYFYVNLSRPYRLEKDILSYVDYDLDIMVNPNRQIELLDQEEYELHKKKYNYPKELQKTIESYLPYIYQLIESAEDPFNEKFVNYWYNKAIT